MASLTINPGNPHQTVLLEEAVQALLTNPKGVYVDATFGRGGHSAALLDRLDAEGKLIALDRDPDAIRFGREQFVKDKRIELVQSEFSSLKSIIVERSLVGHLSGVLLDLGVSSPQLDEPERGFSFMRNGPLDMRMASDKGQTAADWINTASETDIARVLHVYGEERFSRRIARAIVQVRDEQPLTTTAQLADLIVSSVPTFDQGKHPATRSFQAVRLFINSELEELESLLGDIVELLAPGGRLVVISFHSLEDRIVKRFIRDQSKSKVLPKEIPLMDYGSRPPLQIIGKPVRAGAEEVKRNPRARSAIMRVAEKVA